MKTKNDIAFFCTLITVLSGCTTVNERMPIDPTWGGHTSVYEVSKSSKFIGREIDIKFGEYQVAGVGPGFTRVRDTAATGNLLVDLFFHAHEAPGITDVTATNSNTFEFSIGDVTWHADCLYRSRERVVASHVGITSANSFVRSIYQCQYSNPEFEPWTLSIDYGSGRPVEMRNGKEVLVAYSSGGELVSANGRVYDFRRQHHLGYNWMHGSQQVGAVSTRGKTQRVWLDERNSDEITNATAMASVGLIIYHWKIARGTESYRTTVPHFSDVAITPAPPKVRTHSDSNTRTLSEAVVPAVVNHVHKYLRESKRRVKRVAQPAEVTQTNEQQLITSDAKPGQAIVPPGRKVAKAKRTLTIVPPGREVSEARRAKPTVRPGRKVSNAKRTQTIVPPGREVSEATRAKPTVPPGQEVSEARRVQPTVPPVREVSNASVSSRNDSNNKRNDKAVKKAKSPAEKRPVDLPASSRRNKEVSSSVKNPQADD